MKGETRDRRRDTLWALPASLILHAAIIAVLFYGLPTPPLPPQEEQAVSVVLVPPPDLPTPKPAPVPAPKEDKAEKPPKLKVETPPPPEPPKPSPIEVLKPVFQFGDKDTGPTKSPDGNSAQDRSPSPASEDSKPPAVAKDAENKPVPSPDSDEPADAAKEANEPVAATKDPEHAQDVEKQEADKQAAATDDARKLAAAAPTPLAAGDDGEIALPASAKVPRPKPSNVPKTSFAKVSKPRSEIARGARSTDVAVATSQGYSGLPGVRRRYSQSATGDALAATSMAGLSRDKRIAQLCASTLQQQLLDASYFPDLVPLIPLKAGNVLDVPDNAFHTRTTWYRLSFRCEVDTNATRVLSFTFRVGMEIPPDQWARLGLPIRD